jgi:hypothetical protein
LSLLLQNAASDTIEAYDIEWNTGTWSFNSAGITMFKDDTDKCALVALDLIHSHNKGVLKGIGLSVDD